jgi:hypothetical protein
MNVKMCVERRPQVEFVFRIEGITKERVLFVRRATYFPQLEQEQSEPQLPVEESYVSISSKVGWR